VRAFFAPITCCRSLLVLRTADGGAALGGGFRVGCSLLAKRVAYLSALSCVRVEVSGAPSAF